MNGVPYHCMVPLLVSCLYDCIIHYMFMVYSSHMVLAFQKQYIFILVNASILHLETKVCPSKLNVQFTN